METITVNVNDKAVSIATQSTITDLIRQMNIPPQGIAIAISPSAPFDSLRLRSGTTAQEPPLGNQVSNGPEIAREVIPQKQWPDYTLADQQDILIIQATQGG